MVAASANAKPITPTPAVFAAPLSMMGFAVDVMLVGLSASLIRCDA
jgi:hypothetical protein